MSIEQAIKVIDDFKGNSLTKSLAEIENEIVGADASNSNAFCNEHRINQEFMSSALAVKIASSQIDVIIHAAGILQSLSSLLGKGEIVESVSLGAGNTGKKFDLETNKRVAEFKFIDWKGGSETIRQNSVFKDFFELAEYNTEKKKVLYVVDTACPLKFFNSGRAIASVLAKQPEILKELANKYGSQVEVVSDYYELHKDSVAICDVSLYIGRSV